MSKEQLRQHLKNAPPGTTPGGIVAALRKQGVKMEGDPVQLQSQETGQQKLASSLGSYGDPLGKLASGALRTAEYIASPLAAASGLIQKGASKALGFSEGAQQASQDVRELPEQAAMARTSLPLTVGLATAPLSLGAGALATGAAAATGRGMLEASDAITGKDQQSLAGRAMDIAKEGVAVGATDFIAGKALQMAGGAISRAFSKNYDEVVATGIKKGVKPVYRGAMRTSPVAEKQYMEKAKEAVAQILDRSPTMQYVNDAGDVVQGGVPTNLSEFAQAIQQSKKQLFDEYSALTQQATGQGMSVELDDIAQSLLDYADNPVKQAADSAKTAYAIKKAEQLLRIGKLDPSQTEELIKELNSTLAHAYAEKTAKGISEVDMSIANALREKLDKVVLDATGADYQGFKNAYGALKAIEKDVGHRALTVARQNSKGLLDMTDIFTGGDLIAGAISGNPSMFAKGAAGKGLMTLYKNLNSPDANIMRMFAGARRALSENVAKQSVKSILGTQAAQSAADLATQQFTE